MTYVLPLRTVAAASGTDSSPVGVALDGHDPPDRRHPPRLHAGAVRRYSGHVSLHAGYHCPRGDGLRRPGRRGDGHTAMIGCALNSSSTRDSTRNGIEAADLDAYQGRADDVRGYHYHIALTGHNEFVGCFRGEHAARWRATAARLRRDRAPAPPPTRSPGAALRSTEQPYDATDATRARSSPPLLATSPSPCAATLDASASASGSARSLRDRTASDRSARGEHCALMAVCVLEAALVAWRPVSRHERSTSSWSRNRRAFVQEDRSRRRALAASLGRWFATSPRSASRPPRPPRPPRPGLRKPSTRRRRVAPPRELAGRRVGLVDGGGRVDPTVERDPLRAPCFRQKRLAEGQAVSRSSRGSRQHSFRDAALGWRTSPPPAPKPLIASSTLALTVTLGLALADRAGH